MSAPLIGTLTARNGTPPTPAVPRNFHTIELDRPVCLNGSFSEGVVNDIRSVHVYSLDGRTTQLLRRYAGKRVAVRFLRVFEEHTAHHRRPMVGEIDTIAPVR